MGLDLLMPPTVEHRSLIPPSIYMPKQIASRLRYVSAIVALISIAKVYFSLGGSPFLIYPISCLVDARHANRDLRNNDFVSLPTDLFAGLDSVVSL